jgi:translation initiation factor 1 (eIF-1/SUI1)
VIIECHVLPEFCEYNKWSDLKECKEWLMENHEELWLDLYGCDEEDGEETKGSKKKVKKVKFVDPKDKIIRVIKMSRGGKKAQSLIIGLDMYGVKMSDCANKLAKKMATGAQQAATDYKGVTYDAIVVQGDVADRFINFVNNDMKEFKIPENLVVFEDGGNKKTKK